MRVKSAYVSEFTSFINHFLADHPEVQDDQKAGRALYWDRKVDLAAQEAADRDRVPDNQYGFHYVAPPGAEGDPAGHRGRKS